MLITDAKGVYDSIVRSVSSNLGLADKRSAVEALTIKESLAATKTMLRWVHSEAMAADGLTKLNPSAMATALDFAQRGWWRIVQDTSFTAAKKRPKGLDPLADVPCQGVPDGLEAIEDDVVDTQDAANLAWSSDQRDFVDTVMLRSNLRRSSR